MNSREVRKGIKVIDRWFPENGEGEIISVKENETRVKYKAYIRKYTDIGLADLTEKIS